MTPHRKDRQPAPADGTELWYVRRNHYPQGDPWTDQLIRCTVTKVGPTVEGRAMITLTMQRRSWEATGVIVGFPSRSLFTSFSDAADALLERARERVEKARKTLADARGNLSAAKSEATEWITRTSHDGGQQ